MRPAGSRFPVELFATPAAALVLGLALALDQVWLSILAALLHLAVVPGYLVLWALFPEGPRDQAGMTPVERAALSVPVSFGVVAVLGLLLDVLDGGLTTAGVAIAVLAFEAVAFGAGLARHFRTVADRRWSLATLQWPAGPGPAVVAGCAVLAAAALLWFASEPSQDDPYTAVALRVPGNNCYPALYDGSSYRAATRVNDTLVPLPSCPRIDTVTVVVANQEGHGMEYTLLVAWADLTDGRPTLRAVVATEPMAVAHGETGSAAIALGAPAGSGPGFLYFQVFEGAAPAVRVGDSLPAPLEEVRLAIERGTA